MNGVRTIMRAADFAARKHSQQKRGGVAAEPYVNHLREVASLVADATDGDTEAVVAALLHDVVEDQEVTIAEVAERFWAEVAEIAAEATDDKALDKGERKQRQVDSAPFKSPAASIIKLADKTANLRAIADSPPPWVAERKRAYVAWAKAVVAGLPVKPVELLALFKTAAGQAHALSGGGLESPLDEESPWQRVQPVGRRVLPKAHEWGS